MLIVAQWRAIECFAGLEYLRRADVAQRERLDREHRGQLEIGHAERFLQPGAAHSSARARTTGRRIT
ncbi:MAG: hypothetical protein ABI024_15750 [Vicinamibacterales bacterium]